MPPGCSAAMALQADRVAAAMDPQLRALMDARPDRTTSTTYDRVLQVTVDPVRARYGAWYEMFPRSCTPDPARSGTFADADARLPEIAGMGFDVLYLPPIHPIGRTHRKGRNNSLTPEPDDPGSPWAIGAPEGGHTAVEPGLGTIDDFDRFVAAANRARPGGGARHRLPGVAGPPVGARAPAVVQASSRRLDQVRGESAEEVPGHLSDRLRQRRVARRCGRSCAGVPLLGVARRQDLPRRQPAHQGVPRSGSGASPRFSASTRTPSSWPRRSPGRS